MIVKKVIQRRYIIKPPTMKWTATVGGYIKFRAERGQKSKEYEKCFVCEKPLPNDYIPNLAWVETKGNMFVCDECAEKINAETESERE